MLPKSSTIPSQQEPQLSTMDMNMDMDVPDNEVEVAEDDISSHIDHSTSITEDDKAEYTQQNFINHTTRSTITSNQTRNHLF